MSAASLPTPECTDYTSAQSRLREALVQAGAGCLVPELSESLGLAITLLPYREIGKHELLRGYELLRDVLTELSRRLPIGDGVYFLTLAELHKLPALSECDQRSDIDRAIAERRELYRACRKLHVPAVLDVRDDLSDFGRPPPVEISGRTVAGRPLSGGQAVGRAARFVDAAADFQWATDRVVVAATIDPGAMPFLVDAAALVVEQGGVLSHVALLARQLSIPAIVVEGITNLIEPGETIRVDADRGLVEFLDRPT